MHRVLLSFWQRLPVVGLQWRDVSLGVLRIVTLRYLEVLRIETLRYCLTCDFDELFSHVDVGTGSDGEG